MVRKFINLICLSSVLAATSGCALPQYAGEPSKADNEVIFERGWSGAKGGVRFGADTKANVDELTVRGQDGSETTIKNLTIEQVPSATIGSWVAPMQVYAQQIFETYAGQAKVAEANWKGAAEFMRSSVGVAAALAFRAGANGQSFEEIRPMLESLASLNQAQAESQFPAASENLKVTSEALQALRDEIADMRQHVDELDLAGDVKPGEVPPNE